MNNIYYVKDPLLREIHERSAVVYLDLKVMTPEELEKEQAEAEARAENF